MKKNARSKSADPAQEALREAKSQWNANCSQLIGRLIAFKRGINGRGEPRAGLPASSIKDPLPLEVVSYLNELSSYYEHVADQADAIITAQQNYAENRQKKQVRAQWEYIDQKIVKMADFSLAQMPGAAWTYMREGIWNRDETFKSRWDMLNIFADSRMIEKVEDILMSSDEDAINMAVAEYIKFFTYFKKSYDLYLKYLEKYGEKTYDEGQSVDNIQNIINDLSWAQPLIKEFYIGREQTNVLIKLKSLFDKLKSNKKTISKGDFEALNAEYLDLVGLIAKAADVSANSFQEINDKLSASENDYVTTIKKIIKDLDLLPVIAKTYYVGDDLSSELKAITAFRKSIPVKKSYSDDEYVKILNGYNEYLKKYSELAGVEVNSFAELNRNVQGETPIEKEAGAISRAVKRKLVKVLSFRAKNRLKNQFITYVLQFLDSCNAIMKGLKKKQVPTALIASMNQSLDSLIEISSILEDFALNYNQDIALGKLKEEKFKKSPIQERQIATLNKCKKICEEYKAKIGLYV